MVNLRCPVCAGALEKRAGAYLCPKNHSFDIAKSGYVNLLLNSSQGHHGDDKPPRHLPSLLSWRKWRPAARRAF